MLIVYRATDLPTSRGRGVRSQYPPPMRYASIVLFAALYAFAMVTWGTPQLVGDLVHWQHDSFLVRWRDRELRADAYATFSLNPDGTIDVLKMAPASPEVDFSFDFQDLLLRPTPGKS